MVERSPNVSEKDAAMWSRALDKDLWDGEKVLAFVSAARRKPQTSATAITNRRVIGFLISSQSSARIRVQATAGEIRGIEIETRELAPLRVKTTDDEVVFGKLHRTEVHFARRNLEALWKPTAGKVNRASVTSRSIAARASTLSRRPISGVSARPSQPAAARPAIHNHEPASSAPTSTPRSIAARASAVSRKAMPTASSPSNPTRPHKPVSLIKPSSPPITADPAGRLVNELEKLALMYRRGLLDDDEFKAAKRAVINASS
ncbi:hypothetical protein IA539_03975 [Gordonia sp. zg691]|uniref:SHOCT domain-containing protein n=1 Tax=Gordonia jinghuaiqii TaxID=2758710 RepID=UPI00166231B0|nr:SHOCT domain-containing protein [Gordonia jinghuaiqii]MBD0860367.1 hypothetical protein [Gordonia jinghuaiqii]